MCVPVLSECVSPGVLAVWVLVLSGLRMTGFGLLKFLFFLLLIIQISTVAS